MKNSKIWLAGLVLLALAACSKKPTIEDLKPLAATETFPDDTYLDTVSVKRALVIVAHDDDDCFMAGTIAKLKKNGWQIEQLKLVDTPLKEDEAKHPAEIIYTGQQLILADDHFRNTYQKDTTLAPHLAFPKADFPAVFETEKVSLALQQKVNAFKPTVIFTMDHEMGGYGHPEHVFLSELVYNLFQDNKIKANLLYQGVTTDHMEEEIIVKRLTPILKEWGFDNPYLVAKEVYNIEGIPAPELQVNITNVAEEKMKYLQAYSIDARKNIRMFIPHYEEFDAKTYFGIFDREFFRVYEKSAPKVAKI